MCSSGLCVVARLPAALLVALAFVTSAAFTQDIRFASQRFQVSAATPAYRASSSQSIAPGKQKPSPVIDGKFIAMSALVMASTIADIEGTQQCLGNGSCRELNPLMPQSRAGMYAVNLPINAAAMYLSYRLKASGHRTWWIAPLAISGAHAIGAGFVF
jgi:hypothetical protein